MPPLVSSTDKALEYFVKRDLLDENVGPIDQACPECKRRIWQLPEARRMVKKQQADGSWKYPGKKTAVYPEHHYSLVETWKQFRFLVEQYEFNKEHPVARVVSLLGVVPHLLQRDRQIPPPSRWIWRSNGSGPAQTGAGRPVTLYRETTTLEALLSFSPKWSKMTKSTPSSKATLLESHKRRSRQWTTESH
jgi:hypothetical protein